MFEVWWDI